MKFDYWTLVPIVGIGLSGFGWLAIWLMPAIPSRKSDMTAFRERTIARAIKEEAVVGKEVRVVEEVALRKDASENTETARDTMRPTKGFSTRNSKVSLTTLQHPQPTPWRIGIRSRR